MYIFQKNTIVVRVFLNDQKDVGHKVYNKGNISWMDNGIFDNYSQGVV
jgi:hypothetical protein